MSDQQGPRPSRLAFGYNRALPEHTVAAWGCRAIITQDGDVDVLYDRTSTFGDGVDLDRLLSHLNQRAGSTWRTTAAGLLRSGAMDTRREGEHELLNDGVVVIKGNTSGSAGYLYVCAYLIHFEVGRTYRLVHRGEHQPQDVESVLVYLGPDTDHHAHLFNARPVAGTQLIAASWIRSVYEVPDGTACYLNRRHAP